MTKQQTFDCIHEEMVRNDVVLFVKGTPNALECDFSKGTTRLLEWVGARYIGTSAGQVLAGRETRR